MNYREDTHTQSKTRKAPDHLLLISAFCHRLDKNSSTAALELKKMFEVALHCWVQGSAHQPEQTKKKPPSYKSDLILNLSQQGTAMLVQSISTEQKFNNIKTLRNSYTFFFFRSQKSGGSHRHVNSSCTRDGEFNRVRRTQLLLPVSIHFTKTLTLKPFFFFPPKTKISSIKKCFLFSQLLGYARISAKEAI